MSHWVSRTSSDRTVDAERYYRVEDQTCDEVVVLPGGAGGGRLLLYADPDPDATRRRVEGRLSPEVFSRVHFAVMEWESSNHDGSDVRYRLVFHGEGFSGRLRELRHSWWGEPDNAGYMYYPSFEVLSAALTALQKWFDA